MNKLELIKRREVHYVDLDVFEEGEIYYIFDVAKHQTVIAVCLLKEPDKVIFKVINYIRGDFGIWSYDHDKFALSTDTPNLADLHIFPVRLSFLIDPMNEKIMIRSEIDMY